MSINSLQTLKDYCLRQCGAPLVKVNIHDSQLDDRIEEALEFYHEFHNEGQERVVIAHQITQQDMDNGYFQLPENVFAVTSILNTSVSAGNYSWMSAQYELLRNANYDAAGATGGVSDYVIVRQYLADIEAMLSPVPQFTYRYNTRKLQVFDDWSKLFRVGNFITYEAYAIIDQDVYTRLWNDRLLKKLAAGYVMRQYGLNLLKYDSVQMPSGITLNGQSFVDRGQQMIDQAEEEIQDMSEPLGMVMR